MKAFLFPGQGSQTKGMGADLFDAYTDLVDKADNILGYSIKELCLEDSRKELNRTQFTQPAIYVVNALSFISKIEAGAGKPDFVAGHSLGEFNALQAAGAFDFETGLRLVKKRGELMSQATEGGMAAILNASQEKIQKILSDNGLTEIDIANHNAPSQIVISGSREQIIKAQDLFLSDNMQYIPLNTSGAFHSRFMQAARDQFQTFLQEFTFSPLSMPVIANVSARPYDDQHITDNLTAQITSSVQWTETIRYLMSQGKQKANGHEADPMLFEEMGNGDVLTKLVSSIQRQTPIASAEQSETKVAEAATRKAASKEPSAKEKVALWNQQYQIGAKVKSSIYDDNLLETRTEAVVLFQHRPAVYLKGYQGYFDLDELTPA